MFSCEIREKCEKRSGHPCRVCRDGRVWCPGGGQDRCTACDGSGWVAECQVCQGRGQVSYYSVLSNAYRVEDCECVQPVALAAD